MGKKDEGLQDAQQSVETKIRNLRGNCKNADLRSAVRCVRVSYVYVCVCLLCVCICLLACMYLCVSVYFTEREQCA